MKRLKLAVLIVSVCFIALVVDSMFLYFTEFPLFHQSEGGSMTVGQLRTGLKYWGNLWSGKSVTVRGVLETIMLHAQLLPYNGVLKDNGSNASIMVQVDWTEYLSLEGQDVFLTGTVCGSEWYYIEAVRVWPSLVDTFGTGRG